MVILRHGSFVLGIAGDGTIYVMVEGGKYTGLEAGVLRLCAPRCFCLRGDREGEDRKKCSNDQDIHYSHEKGISALLSAHKQLLNYAAASAHGIRMSRIVW